MRPWAASPATCAPPTCIRRCISGRCRSGGWCSDPACSPPACCRCCAAWSRSGWSGSSPSAAPIRPVVAMLLTLGCYGFVYTNAIARGFAAAEMLTLCGVALLLGGRRVLAGAVPGRGLLLQLPRGIRRGRRASLLPEPGSRSRRRSRSLASMPGSLSHSTLLARASFRRSRCGRAWCGWRSIRSRRCLVGCRCMSMAAGGSR